MSRPATSTSSARSTESAQARMKLWRERSSELLSDLEGFLPPSAPSCAAWSSPQPIVNAATRASVTLRPMPTPAQLRRLADADDAAAGELEARGRALLERAATRRRQAAELRRLAGVSEGAGLPNMLPKRSISRSNMDLDTTGQSKNVKIAARKTKREHPAKSIWLKAGKTDRDIAAEVGVGRSTVSAWMAPEGPGNRPVPRRHAEYFLERYGVPIASWARLAG